MLSTEDPESYAKPEILTDPEIFTRIWTEPRVVFRFLQAFRYDRYTYILVFLAAFANALDRAGRKGMGEDHSLIYILIMTFVFGGIFGSMFYYIYIATVSGMGRWFGGTASASSLLRVFAHASFPAILSLVITMIQIALFGIDLFKSEIKIDNYDITTNVIYFGSFFIEGSLAIWSLCLFVIGVSEVQKISIGRAIGNVLLPGVILVGVLVLIVLPFVL